MFSSKANQAILFGKANLFNKPPKNCLVKLQNVRYLQDPTLRWGRSKSKAPSTELTISEGKKFILDNFPDHYRDGKYIDRTSYVDFIDEGLQRIKEYGLNRNLDVYKELLKIFPPGRYCKKSMFDFGRFHAPQQLAAVRVLEEIEQNKIPVDKELEDIVTKAFGVQSHVWLKVTRMNYWMMKGKNVDPNPLPEVLPTESHQIAKVALVRMLTDSKSVVTVKSTSNIPNAIDKTWIVSAQSPSQQAIIERLGPKSILFIEEGGTTHVKDKFLNYYVLKVYDDDETRRRRNTAKPQPDYNYDNLKMSFYGLPVKEKLDALHEEHHVDDYNILAIGMTGTSSHDSLLSWLKLLQTRNPKLRELSVVFKIERPTHDVTMSPKTESR